MGNVIPIIPVAIERSTMRDVAPSATTIRRMAPNRSIQAARLKKTHHRTIASPPTNPPNTLISSASGHTIGTPNLRIHSSVTATTPGHSRSGFLGACSSAGRRVTFRQYSSTRNFVPLYSANFPARLTPEQSPFVPQSLPFAGF